MSSDSDEGLSQDTLFSLLSNARRRFTLQYLSRAEGPVDFQELVTEVAAWENDTDPADLSQKQRKRLYVSLYQTHIPKLEEAGIVEYDEDTGEVELLERDGNLNRYLEEEAERGRPWHLYYLGLAVTGVLVYGALTIDAVPVGEIGTALIGLMWVAVLAGLAIYHYTETSAHRS